MAGRPGLSHDDAHRYRWGDKGPIPSVTTVLGVINKPALLNWAKTETAACAVRNIQIVQNMIDATGPDSAVGWLRNIPDYKRDAAADLGTRVHRLAELVINGYTFEPPSADEQPYVNAFFRFWEEKHPEYIEVETQVCHLKLGYAGTFDGIADIDGARYLLDIKTAKNVYPETALQLAAYKHAEFIGREDDPTEYPMPSVHRCAVIHLRPDETYRLVHYSMGEKEWRAFRSALDLYNWLNGAARKVMS